VHNDGTLAVQITGGPPPFAHESYDTFSLSADAQRIYLFANDLGTITVESWSAVSGAYLGAVGPRYPNTNFEPWPNNFQPNYAIGEVHTRTAAPSFGGDLFYVGPLGPHFDSTKPVIDIVNTTTHQFVEQIVLPTSVTSIFDFALGPGALGPRSRAYLSTNIGLLSFEETSATPLIGFDPNFGQPIFDLTHFRLASSTPLLSNLSPSAYFDIGPDGYLYVLDGAGTASSIKRYNTATGAMIDTFLNFNQYNFGGVVGANLKFGPDGGLYFSSRIPAPMNLGPPRLVISRFDISTGQRTNDYDLGLRATSDFYVLPVPEPSSAVLMLLGLLFVGRPSRAC
jgi:hypothetical protein